MNVFEPRNENEIEDDEESKEKEEKQEKEIGEMDIDRDLMASEKAGIIGFKKKKKKKKKKRNAQAFQAQPEEMEENAGGIQAAPKKRKKKKKRRGGESHNLGAEPQVRKKQKQEKSEFLFNEVDPEILEDLEDFEMTCSCCPFGCDELSEYKAHFKTDWHRFNAMRKAKSLFMVSEEQYKESLIIQDFI
jgi:hypothetical protein